MVTRIKVIFAICLFCISALISELLFGEGGYYDSLALRRNVEALHQYEEKKKEELSFLRESTPSMQPSMAVESSLVLSFDSDVAYKPYIDETEVVDENYKPLSKIGCALVGLAVSSLFLAIMFVVEKIKVKKHESRDN